MSGCKYQVTKFSSSVEETRWNACRECGSSRGAIGSQEPSFGALILMRICQLQRRKYGDTVTIGKTIKFMSGRRKILLCNINGKSQGLKETTKCKSYNLLREL